MSASRSITPSSTRDMMPAHVIVFDTEASMKTVSSFAWIPRSMFAHPEPAAKTTLLPLTTATDIPGLWAASRCCRRNAWSPAGPAATLRMNEKGAIAPAPATTAALAKTSRRVIVLRPLDSPIVRPSPPPMSRAGAYGR
jgi:hypothetical protein